MQTQLELARTGEMTTPIRHLLFPEQARSVRASRMPENQKTCTMCGDFCAMERGLALFQPDISADKTVPAETCV